MAHDVHGPDSGSRESVSAGELSALKAEQTRLAAEVERLGALVARIARELGMEEQA